VATDPNRRALREMFRAIVTHEDGTRRPVVSVEDEWNHGLRLARDWGEFSELFYLLGDAEIEVPASLRETIAALLQDPPPKKRGPKAELSYHAEERLLGRAAELFAFRKMKQLVDNPERFAHLEKDARLLDHVLSTTDPDDMTRLAQLIQQYERREGPVVTTKIAIIGALANEFGLSEDRVKAIINKRLHEDPPSLWYDRDLLEPV